MKPARIIKLSLFLAVLFCLAGCTAYNDSAAGEVNPQGWESRDTCRVVFHNSDTVSLRTMEVFVVYDRRFGHLADPLILSLTAISPDSVKMTEMVTLYPPAAESGQSRYYHSSFTFRADALLSREGEYRFFFSHSSIAPLQGIKAVGVTINP